MFTLLVAIVVCFTTTLSWRVHGFQTSTMICTSRVFGCIAGGCCLADEWLARLFNDVGPVTFIGAGFNDDSPVSSDYLVMYARHSHYIDMVDKYITK